MKCEKQIKRNESNIDVNNKPLVIPSCTWERKVGTKTERRKKLSWASFGTN